MNSTRGKGRRGVFFQPIGFVCDHVEILYDIDIAFRDFAAKLGMKIWRAESLNNSVPFAQAIADIARTRSRGRSRMTRVAIIGGGISGLSAAYASKKRALRARPSNTVSTKAVRASAARCTPRSSTAA